MNNKKSNAAELMKDGIRISVFESIDAAEVIWKWFEQNGDCYAFQNFHWLKHWYNLIGRNLTIRVQIVLVESVDGKPLMLLPLGIQKRSIASCLIWLGGQISDYQGALLSSDCSERLTERLFLVIWKAIQETLPHFDANVLEKQPELIGTQKNPLLYLSCEPHASSAHYTQLSKPLNAFVKTRRSNKWLSGVRRKQRRLAEHGKIEFTVLMQGKDVQITVDTMILQKSQSYKKLGVADIFEEHGHRDFVKTLSDNQTENGFVYLCKLTLDERIIATHWGLIYKQRFYHLFPTYEHGIFAKYSPGNILLLNMFEWCIQNGVCIYDFTVGDEPYKDHWCDQKLNMYDHFQASTFRGLLYIWPLRLQRKLKRRIKQSPFLWRAFTTLRSSVSRIKSKQQT